MLDRVALLRAIASILEPLDFVLALWQGGSESHGATDEWSDLDLRVLVADGCQEKTFHALEAGLQQFSSIRLRYRVPEPAWHSIAQCFYQLAKTNPLLLIDFTVMQRSIPDRYDYEFKYFDRDFSSEVKIEITKLMCIRDLKDLQAKQQQADWFDRTFAKIIGGMAFCVEAGMTLVQKLTMCLSTLR